MALIRPFFYIVAVCLYKSIITRTEILNESHFMPCSTGRGKSGSCIYLKDCAFVYNIVRTTILTKRDRFYLRQNQCGYRDNQVLICCPKEQRKLPTVINKYLPKPGECGFMSSSNRIYGGNITKIDEFPWMALMEYSKANRTGRFMCGGSLISDSYVLTAAHCVTTNGPVLEGWRLKSVRLGEWDLDNDIDCVTSVTGEKDCAPKALDIEIERVVQHPLYRGNLRNHVHDIALIRLTKRVTFTDFIKPICLPLEGSLRQATFNGAQMIIAGWGKTESSWYSKIKLKAYVEGFDMDKCRSLYDRTVIDQSQICAGGEQGVDSCKGDSGGPLIISAMNQEIGPYYCLAGITSFGPWPCGVEDWPGVYTRVSEYIEWITQNIHQIEMNITQIQKITQRSLKRLERR